MKIVQAVGWYFPEALGGTEVYVAGLARRLRDAGHEVLVAVPDATRAAPATTSHDGVEVLRYPIPPAPTRAESQGLAIARGAETFHAWLAAERPDVVHVHSLVTGLGVREILAARRAGARVFVTAHTPGLGFTCQRGTMMRDGTAPCDGITRPGVCATCALGARGLPRGLARLAGAIPARVGSAMRGVPGRIGTALAMTDLIARNQASQRAVLAAVDRLVVLTQWALEIVAANGAPREKLALNRLGSSHDKPMAKAGPDEKPTTSPPTIAYLGRLDPIKGVHDLVRAAASLPREMAMRVEVRGPATGEAARRYAADLQRLAAGDPRIAIEPPIAPADVPAHLARCAVLCCPSLCLEGGPTVAIEAHAVGTPVIGTRIGGLAELVDDGVSGRLVAPGDWRALAACLASIARDPRGTVDRWRRALPPARTMDDVAADSLEMYRA